MCRLSRPDGGLCHYLSQLLGLMQVEPLSSDKYQKPHVLVAKLFTIFIYKDLLRVLCY